MFVMLFLAYYKSDNKIKRELSLLALAAAAAIKIYPLVFLMLLFVNGRFSDIVKTVVYFLLLFFVPFLFFQGGFNNIGYFMRNMFFFSGNVIDYSKIKWDNYSMVTVLQFVSLFFKGSINSNTIISANSILTVLFVVSVIVSSMIIKSDWKVYALLALCITAVPIISFIYTQVFFIPAFICFIKAKGKSKKDIWYFILFLIILLPLNRFIFSYNHPVVNWPIDFPWYYNNPYAPFAEGWQPFENPINTLIAVLAMALMYLTIITDSVVMFICSVRSKGFKNALISLLPLNKNNKESQINNV